MGSPAARLDLTLSYLEKFKVTGISVPYISIFRAYIPVDLHYAAIHVYEVFQVCS